MSNTCQAVMNSTINCYGLLDTEATAVLVNKGGIKIILQNFSEVFLTFTVALVNEAIFVMAVVLFHVGIQNSTVSTNISGSRHTTRLFLPKPGKATMTLSGWAMFPPMAVT